MTKIQFERQFFGGVVVVVGLSLPPSLILFPRRGAVFTWRDRGGAVRSEEEEVFDWDGEERRRNQAGERGGG